MGPIQSDNVVFDPTSGTFVSGSQGSPPVPQGGLPGAGPGQVGPAGMHAPVAPQWAPGVSPTPTATIQPQAQPSAKPVAPVAPVAPAGASAPGAAPAAPSGPGMFTRIGNAFQGVSPPTTDTQHPGDNALAGASRGIQSAYQGISSLFT